MGSTGGADGMVGSGWSALLPDVGVGEVDSIRDELVDVDVGKAIVCEPPSCGMGSGLACRLCGRQSDSVDNHICLSVVS